MHISKLMYDIIGDIHGHASELKDLLNRLGYSLKTQECFRHPERKAVFVGDFVDRGPDVRGVIDIVRPMVECGAALAIVGNHEFNLLSYFRTDDAGNPLRPHVEKNAYQNAATRHSYGGYGPDLEDVLLWFQTLPVFLELDGLRVVHAAWTESAISWMRTNAAHLRLTDEILRAAAIPDSPAFEAIEVLLKGVEVELPSGHSFQDIYGQQRTHMRMRWWLDPNERGFQQMCLQGEDLHPDLAMPKDFSDLKLHYPLQAPPLFLGHYCFEHTPPELLAPNVCCVDFCVVKLGRICAYRWQGEQQVRADHLIW